MNATKEQEWARALLTKLPCLDLTWPDEVIGKWFKVFWLLFDYAKDGGSGEI